MVNGDKLHCNLCGSSFGTRSNVRRDHCESDRHKERLGAKANEKKQQTILAAFSEADKTVEQTKQCRLVDSHRLRVMEALMESNIKIHQISPKLRELLEENREFHYHWAIFRIWQGQRFLF
jgi:hypothetical protein